MKFKAFVVLSVLFLSGCNTIQGIGEDIQAVGKALEHGAK